MASKPSGKTIRLRGYDGGTPPAPIKLGSGGGQGSAGEDWKKLGEETGMDRTSTNDQAAIWSTFATGGGGPGQASVNGQKLPDPMFIPQIPVDTVKNTLIPAAWTDAARASSAWNEYQTANPTVKIDKTNGIAYKLVATQGSSIDENGNPVPEYKQVQDPVGTSLLQWEQDAKQKLSDYQSGLKYALGAGGATAESYLTSEGRKTSEVKRQLEDALTRMKAVYDLENNDQSYAANAIKNNVEQQQAMQAGLMDFGMSNVFLPNRPHVGNYADIIARTVPGDVMPDYRLNGAVGLPGGEGFPTSFASQQPVASAGGESPPEDWTLGARGYAGGTGPALGAMAVDPEIAWMVGMPDIPIHMNTPTPQPPASWFPQGQAPRMWR